MSIPRAARSVATSTGSRPALKSASTFVRAPWLSIAVERRRRDARAAQLVGHVFAGVAGRDEDQHTRPRALADQVAQQRRAPRRVDFDGALHRRSVRRPTRARHRRGPVRAAGRPPAPARPAGTSPRRTGSGAGAAAARAPRPARRRSRPPAGDRLRRAPGRPRRDRSSALCAIRSSRRPGVATTMSAPPRNAIICGLIDTPPNTIASFIGSASGRASARSVAPTCAASSRVGISTSACTRLGAWRTSASMRCSTGSENAAVLPDPVSADASTSRPASTAGMAAD